MRKYFFTFLFTVIAASTLYAQQPLPLPVITVKNMHNKIIVSWVNGYTKPVATLNIQRSYDSLKNFSTIGSVLSAQSRENGYTDPNPPYTRMYYRIFIAFEGGSYIITPSVRPVKDAADNEEAEEIRYPWMADPTGLSPKDSLSPSVIPPRKNRPAGNYA